MFPHLFDYLKTKLVVIGWGALVAALALTLVPLPKVPTKTVIAAPTLAVSHNSAAYGGLKITAKSAIVLNLKTNTVIFEKNSKEVKPLASITKLMTALTASDYLGPEDQVKIEAPDLAGGSNAGLDKSHTWRFSDLRDYMLTTSSNGAAIAIARTASLKASSTSFETLMNTKAQSLGLASMSFGNPTGLSTANMPIGTANDVALLLKNIYETKPELLNSTRWSFVNKTSLDKRRYIGQNTNQAVNSIFGLLGSKTGFTDEAGGNLAIIFDAGVNMPMAVVVLDSTYDGRFQDIDTLVKATLSYYAH